MIEDLEGEVWKDVVGWEGRYKVSNKCRVKSINHSTSGRNNVRYKEVLRKTTLKPGGYNVMILSKPGRRLMTYSHRLMMVAFVPNPDNKQFINHIDCDPTNNSLDNLEWCTPRENLVHAYKMNRRVIKLGADHPCSLLDNLQAKVIKSIIQEGSLKGRELAKYFKINEVVVSSIKLNKTWKHI